MAERAIAADPFALAAREHVAITALGELRDTPGRNGQRPAAVRPVTAIRLPGGDLLTAAHTLPGLQGDQFRRDPATGALRFNNRAAETEDLILVVDGAVSRARIGAADLLRYAATENASRESVPADWAILELGRVISANVNPSRKVGTPVPAIGTARVGERCVLVGYPKALMDDALFETRGGVNRLEDLRFLDAPAVVIDGAIEQADTERVEIAIDGVLGADGRGLSGGGVFVERRGRPVLVGVVVQASSNAARVTACALPRAVRDRF